MGILKFKAFCDSGKFFQHFSLRRRKTVATAGRSYGGPSQKSVGGFGVNFQKLPPNFSEVAFMWNHQTQRILGQLLRSLLQNPRNFSEIAPEVRPAVHTAPLRLKFPAFFPEFPRDFPRTPEQIQRRRDDKKNKIFAF